MDIFDKGLITILVVSLLLMAVALPLVLRKIPPNNVYGFRTHVTRNNETIWYEANAYFGRNLIYASLCSICIVVTIHLFRPVSAEQFLPVSVLAMAAPSLIATYSTMLFIRKLTNESNH